MTETACLISVSRPDDRCIGYNGRLMAGMEGRIVDGELQLAGLNITPGYFELPEVSAEMFATDESGKKWLKTGTSPCQLPLGVADVVDSFSGDIVELNPDGHINVTDRIKELIKYVRSDFLVPYVSLSRQKGFQVAPARPLPASNHHAS
jgi:long-subunit acyl-CoA synthetase (AMP-forming)